MLHPPPPLPRVVPVFTPHNTGPSVRCTVWNLKLIVLKYFSLPFTLFEPCGAVFNMNSKVHLRRNSGKDFQPLCLGYSSLLFLCSSVSCCRRCFRCAKRCSLCSAISCWHLLLRCSGWISSRRSRSRGISVENLTRRGIAATCMLCCCYVSFVWKIARDSPIVNTVSQTMSKYISFSWIKHENAPWLSAAKSLLPGNAKCSMT